MMKLRLVSMMLTAATWLAAQTPAPTLENATPLTATDWVAWSGYNPTRVHLFRVDQPPEDWGAVEFSISTAVRGRREVVLIGENHVAVRPYPGTGGLTTIELPGYWSQAAATAAGYVITDDSSALAFSTDGRSWEKVEAPMFKDGQTLALVAGDGKFVMLVDRRIDDGGGTPWRAGDIWTSNDGRTWRNTYFGETSLENRPFEKLAYQNKQWVAMGRYNALVSTDGENWQAMASEVDETDYTTGPKVELMHFAAGGGRWWVMDWDNQVLSSADGVDWTNATKYDLGDFYHLRSGWVLGPQGLVNPSLESDGKLVVDDFDHAMVREEALAAARLKAEQEAWRLQQEREVAEAKAEAARIAKAKADEEKRFYADWIASELKILLAKDMTELSGYLAKHIEFLHTGPLDEKTKAALLAGAMDFAINLGGPRGAANFGRNLKGENLKRWNAKVATYNQQMRTWLKEAEAEVAGGRRLPANWSGDQGWKAMPRGKVTAQRNDFMDVQRVRKSLVAGNAGAAYDLMHMYNAGWGVPQDNVMQLFWNRVTIELLPEYERVNGAEFFRLLVKSKSAMELAAQAAYVIHEQGGVIDAKAFSFLLPAGNGGATLASKVALDRGSQAERLKTINALLAAHADPDDPLPPLTALPVGNGLFALKYPAPAVRWSADKIEQWRPAFERHRALSADIIKLVETMGNDTDLSGALQKIAARHPQAWAEQLPKELAEAYTGSMGSAIMLTDRQADFSKDSVQNILAWTGMMTQLDGASAETWFQRARLLYWSGEPGAALRAVRMASALGSRGIELSLHSKAIQRLQAELSLPPEVRDLPQKGEIDYNVGLLAQATLLGKDYAESQVETAAALYRNFGTRLVAAWARPDAAEILPLVYQAHATEIENVRYPNERMEAVETEFVRIQELQKTDTKAALVAVEKLAAESPLAGIIRLHAVIMLELDRLEIALADVEGSLLLEPKSDFGQRLKANLQQRLEHINQRARKAQTTRLDALLIEAKKSFRSGDAAAGKAKLDAILKEGPEHVGSLLLLATWQETNAPASMLETLNKVVAADPKSEIATARLILALAQQRKLPEAQKLAQQAVKDFPRSGVITAADTMVKVFGVMLARQAPMEIARSSLPALDTAIGRAADDPLPYAVRAQLHMILGNRPAAMTDMVRVVELSDYTPAAGLKQLIGMLEQQGMTAEAEAVRARLPQN